MNGLQTSFGWEPRDLVTNALEASVTARKVTEVGEIWKAKT